MTIAATSLSPELPAELKNSAADGAAPAGRGGTGGAGGAILADRWPSLATAMSRYHQSTAEAFTKAAYEAVEAGLIRHADRQRLAEKAAEMGIRDFDAQLLIACAVRQWALDRRYDARPSLAAPKLSFEYKSWRRAWMRVAILLGTAAAVDALVLWKWLG